LASECLVSRLMTELLPDSVRRLCCKCGLVAVCDECGRETWQDDLKECICWCELCYMGPNGLMRCANCCS
jgi:hypothetical protein